MRRVLLATLTIVALVAVSFGVGWVVSGSEERTGADRSPVVALRPLPVPRVIIQHGPWKDPMPTLPARAARDLRLRLGVANALVDVYRVLGMDPPSGFVIAPHP